MVEKALVVAAGMAFAAFVISRQVRRRKVTARGLAILPVWFLALALLVDHAVLGLAVGGSRQRAETAERLLATEQAVREAELTTFAEDQEMLAALRAGARGYLTKDAEADEVVRAMRRVTSGDADLAPQVQRRLLEMLPGHPPAPQGPPPDGLTERELQVLRLVAEGLSNTEIAGRLHVSDATVKTHINHLFAKTGVRDRAQAVAYAYRHRLVTG
ncbi:response regulator transcription factor [Dactylosporangium sp. NPDC050588]|uniref:response regulator transcription factor n=1 Tax=Dactylosporangium sp. NPDC050588 TaxID=3157211 RepID=UPI003408A986